MCMDCVQIVFVGSSDIYFESPTAAFTDSLWPQRFSASRRLMTCAKQRQGQVLNCFAESSSLQKMLHQKVYYVLYSLSVYLFIIQSIFFKDGMITTSLFVYFQSKAHRINLLRFLLLVNSEMVHGHRHRLVGYLVQQIFKDHLRLNRLSLGTKGHGY